MFAHTLYCPLRNIKWSGPIQIAQHQGALWGIAHQLLHQPVADTINIGVRRNIDNVQMREFAAQDMPCALGKGVAQGLVHDQDDRNHSGGHGTFECLDEKRTDIKPGLFGDLYKACRTGYVNLGQKIANNIQPDQQQPPLCKYRRQ